MNLRAPRDDDFDAIHALLDVSSRATLGEPESRDELRLWLDSPTVDPQRDVRLLEDDGRLVGYVDVDPIGEDPVRWWCDLRVHPDEAIEATAPVLVEWAESRAQNGILRVWSLAGDERRIAALEGLGFARSRLSYRMKIELGETEPEVPAWPDGISVRTFADGDERAVYEAHRETWRDSWEPTVESYEVWAHWYWERTDFDPSLWFLACDGDDIAGYSLCRPHEANPEIGWVQLLGVRRPWRRRGLGEALLRHSFREFHRRGFRRVDLGVDAESPTGATRLYGRAGMQAYRVTVFHDKQLGRG